MILTFEIVFIIIVVIAAVLLLFTYIKNTKKIKLKETEAKKPKENPKQEVVVDKRQEVSASDLSESFLKEDNYLHNIFSSEKESGDDESRVEKTTKRAPTFDDLSELDIDFEEGVFDDSDFEKMFDDEDFEEDFDIGIRESSKSKKNQLSEEFSNLSDDMKKLIITNVLNDKKSDD